MEAIGIEPLSYQWQRNGTDIPGETAATLTIANTTLENDGDQFRVVVTSVTGSVTSDPATLTVVDGTRPVATIVDPVDGTMYNAGDTYSFSGTGTDAEDGNLDSAAFTWEIVFHHDAHTHPFIEAFGGATSGDFTIPTVGETSANVWYRVHLTVIDSTGLTDSTFRDIFPNTSEIALVSEPSGLELLLDGQPTASGTTVESVVGVERMLGTPSPQQIGNTVYEFQSWSHGTNQSHTIATPATDTTFTANFQPTGVVVIPAGADWRYLDDGSNQGTTWRDSAFDDSGWSVGPTEAGYGDGDEATTVSFGPDGNNKYITTYFRHEFHLGVSASSVDTLSIGLLRDDGAAVYLNGHNIVLDNLVANALYDTFASGPGVPVGGADESTFYPFVIDVSTLPAGTLLDGNNVVAVEIHQANSTSSDISFNLEMTAMLSSDASVVARHVFYNQSQFDGDDPAANANDDTAIASDKTPLLAGNVATIGNYISYVRGLNGVMVDVQNLADRSSLSSSDFQTRIGNDNNPAGWPAGPPPSSVVVREGAGVGGSDRVTLIWPNNALENTWVEITVLDTPATGLSSPDVFYVGSAVGESGDAASHALVNGFDFAATRDRTGTGAAVDNATDFNRDRSVDGTDLAIARDHTTNITTALNLISLAGGPPLLLASESGALEKRPGESISRSASVEVVRSDAPSGDVRFSRSASRPSYVVPEVADEAAWIQGRLPEELLTLLASCGKRTNDSHSK